MKAGQEAFGKRDFLAAELAFRQAIREQPRSARAWKLLGMVYSAQEQYQKAEEPLSRACSLDPHEENACYYLGRLYYTLGRFEESQRAFGTALNNAPDHGRPLHGLALLREAMGDSPGAERYFQAAIRANEKPALVDYGRFLLKQGRAAESIQIFRSANATAELERASRALTSLPLERAKASPLPVRFEPSELPMVVKQRRFWSETPDRSHDCRRRRLRL